MRFDITKVAGIGEYGEKRRKDDEGRESVLYVIGGGKAFLVFRDNTLEVRCDAKLSKVLREQYESVMESRYFGRGGVEIVLSGQLSDEELNDLVRLSYNLTVEFENDDMK